MPYGMPPFAAIAVRQRGRGRRHLHPHRLGQPRHCRSRPRRPTSCARHRSTEAVMINSATVPRQPPSPRTTRSMRSSGPGPRGALTVAGIATAIVVALWFAFYLFVFLPRGVAPMTACPPMTEHHGHDARARRRPRRAALGDCLDRASSCCSSAWRPSPASTRRRCRRRASRRPIRRTLHLAGEFVESNLGSAVEPDGSVTVRAIGQQYSFTPQCIAGAGRHARSRSGPPAPTWCTAS